MPLTFLWKKFGQNLVKKYAFAFVGIVLAMLSAPNIVPILAAFGIAVTTAEGVTTIVINHALAGAAVAAAAFTFVEGLRVLAAKHPKSPLSESAKSVI